MNVFSDSNNTAPPPDSPSATMADHAPAKVRRKTPWALRLAPHARVLGYVSRGVARFESLLSSVLLVRRPPWVDPIILALRGSAAVAEELDARVHAAIYQAGTDLWPCYTVVSSALAQHYRDSYIRGTYWYTVPDASGKRHNVVLANSNGHHIWDSAKVAISAVWAHYGQVIDLRSPGGNDPAASAGDPLLTGVSDPRAAALAAETATGERTAVLLLGAPSVGKSHIIEQIAASHAATSATRKGRPGRVLRLPDAAACGTTTLTAIIDIMEPDVVVVHDLDTDAPKDATLLRFAEHAAKRGVLLLCTVNSTEKLHDAAIAEHRFGKPIVIESAAPVEVVRAVLGTDVEQKIAVQTGAWDRVRRLPLGAVTKVRKAIECGRTVDDAIAARESAT